MPRFTMATMLRRVNAYKLLPLDDGLACVVCRLALLVLLVLSFGALSEPKAWPRCSSVTQPALSVCG